MKNPEIKTQEKYHTEILKVWDKGKSLYELKEIYEREAFVQDTLYKNTILFLGVGASYSEEKIKSCKSNGTDPIQYESEEGRKYQYYRKMIVLAKENGFCNWSNIDITLLRETIQEKVKPLFVNIKFKEFMQAQFDLAVKMIIDIKPKVVVVSNAFVRDILKGKIKNIKINTSFSFNEDEETIKKYGTQLIYSPERLKGIPIFFTSVLSGAGALDNGSFERLSWHIKYVLEKI